MANVPSTSAGVGEGRREKGKGGARERGAGSCGGDRPQVVWLWPPSERWRSLDASSGSRAVSRDDERKAQHTPGMIHDEM